MSTPQPPRPDRPAMTAVDEVRRRRVMRWGASAVVLLLVATLAGAGLAWRSADDRAEDDARRELGAATTDMVDWQQRVETALAITRTVLNAPAAVGDEALFRRVAWLTVSRGPATSLSWAPYVTREGRAAFERDHGTPIFGYADGKLTRPQVARPRYVPIGLVVPALDGYDIGFDCLSDGALAAAVADAVKSGRPRATEPLDPGHDGSSAVLIYDPVRSTTAVRSTGWDGLLGFAVATVDLATLPASVTAGGLRLSDGDRVLAGPAVIGGSAVIARLEFAGRRWLLETPVASASLTGPGVVLGSGLLMTIGLGLVLSGAARRERYAVDRVQKALAHRRPLEVELAALASTDHLTGLANKREFQKRLDDEFERAKRHVRPLALVIIDLDHFKQINDGHGHQVGDAVLREVAGRLAGQARAGELVARIGGEEFAWLLTETDGMGAYEAAERARRAVASRPFDDVGRLTISAGIADLEDTPSAAELMRLADAALYWAKASGRNQCFRFSAELADLTPVEQAERLERARSTATIRALARTVDAKDPATHRHSERVADLAVRLAAELGWSSARRELIREAGLVHDVGKIGVPDSLLFVGRPLDTNEELQVRAHSAIGAEIVTGVLGDEQAGWIRHHHERWDGAGYPDGLRGEEISEGARILALAEAYDAMTVARTQPPPLGQAEALEECRSQRGRQFGPREVGALEAALARPEPARRAPRPS